MSRSIIVLVLTSASAYACSGPVDDANSSAGGGAAMPEHCPVLGPAAGPCSVEGQTCLFADVHCSQTSVCVDGQWDQGSLDCHRPPSQSCDELPPPDSAWVLRQPGGAYQLAVAQGGDLIRAGQGTLGIELVRLDASTGQVLDTVANIDGIAAATDLHPLPGGGWLMAGVLEGDLSQNGFTLVGAERAHFVLAFDDAWVAQWGTSFGDGRGSYRAFAAGSTDGAVSAAAGMDEGADFGPFSVPTVGHDDVLLGQVLSPGQVAWAQGFGSTSNDAPIGIHRTPGGDTLLATRAFGDIDFGGGVRAVDEYGLALSRHTSTGAHVWSRTCVGDHVAQDAVFDDQGNAYVLVWAEHGIDCGVPLPASDMESAVIKFDADGQHQWSQRVLGSSGNSTYGRLAWHATHGLAVVTEQAEYPEWFFSVQQLADDTGQVGTSARLFMTWSSPDTSIQSATITDDGHVVMTAGHRGGHLCDGGPASEEEVALVASFAL